MALWCCFEHNALNVFQEKRIGGELSYEDHWSAYVTNHRLRVQLRNQLLCFRRAGSLFGLVTQLVCFVSHSILGDSFVQRHDNIEDEIIYDGAEALDKSFVACYLTCKSHKADAVLRSCSGCEQGPEAKLRKGIRATCGPHVLCVYIGVPLDLAAHFILQHQPSSFKRSSSPLLRHFPEAWNVHVLRKSKLEHIAPKIRNILDLFTNRKLFSPKKDLGSPCGIQSKGEFPGPGIISAGPRLKNAPFSGSHVHL
nr:hypothetical protein Iba_chr06cCG16710 [Ipomoea batatas]